jgi:acetyl-CoA carboxylase carboxyl transferase subunit beta
VALPERTPAQSTRTEKRSLGQGLFRKCTGCGTVLTIEDLASRLYVCPSCGYHHMMSNTDWRKLLLDKGELERWDEHIATMDPLEFADSKPYPDRIARAQATTGATEAIETGHGLLGGIHIAYGAYNFAFMGGSMGSVVGERITRMFERATSERLPVVLLHASGGARMQEGILSLMQMAKTMSALGRFRSVKKPYISVLLDPTTGGVAASTAFLGDVNVVEPNAQIGFAGARVIEATIKATLPPGFQRSEFLLEHGMVDTIVPRSQMKARLRSLLSLLGGEVT